MNEELRILTYELFKQLFKAYNFCFIKSSDYNANTINKVIRSPNLMIKMDIYNSQGNKNSS